MKASQFLITHNHGKFRLTFTPISTQEEQNEARKNRLCGRDLPRL